MRLFNKITIIGVGLIGGSIGLACKKAKIAGEITGLCRRESSRLKALRYKAVDKATLDFSGALMDADLVIIASSVSEIVSLARKAVKFMKKGALLTDVGSSKLYIVNEIELFAAGKISFVGSHPMAGSDKTGVQNASPDIFKNAPLILTKTKRTDLKSLETLSGFWKSLGCQVFILSPEEHDKRISFASYLPHVVSFALSASQTSDSVKYSAGSLKDMTRVSLSDPELWRDILLSARKDTLKAIEVFRTRLTSLENGIRKRDGRLIEKFLKRAKKTCGQFHLRGGTTGSTS